MKKGQAVKNSSQLSTFNFQLPKGWEVKNFESCLEKVTYTKKIKRKEFLEDGAFPVVSQEQNFINGYWNIADDLFEVKTPITIFGDHTKVVKYIDFDFVLGADGVKILKSKSEIEPKFFYYYLQSIDLGDLGYARHYRILKEIDVYYPKSLPEQQRIVKILDKAFVAIDKAKQNAEQNLSNAKEVFENYLQGLFDDKAIQWDKFILKNLLQEQPRNGWSPPLKYHSEVGIPVLKLSAVTGFEFDVEKCKYTTASTDEASYYWLRNGDLLISRSNTPELVGHVAISNNIESPTIYPDLIMKMKPKKNLVSTSFLYYQLRSSKLRKEIMMRAHGANPTMKKINKADVQSLPILLCDKETQNQIVANLDQLLEKIKIMESIYQRKISSILELKKSILQKAFRGEL